MPNWPTQTRSAPDALHADGHVHLRQPGTIAMVDFDGGAFHRTQPITLEHVQTVLRRVSGRRGHPEGPPPRRHLDRSRLSGDGLSPGAGAAGRRRRAYPFAARRPGSQPRPWRRDEPGLEAGRRDQGMRRPACSTAISPNGIRRARRILDWSRAQVALMRPSPECPRARSHHPRPYRDARRRNIFR